MSDVQLRQPIDHLQYSHDGGYERQAMEAAELAAFEKGRMQGEMEAIRRAEANAPLKTMGPDAVTLQTQQNALAMSRAPDVLEINRTTIEQKVLFTVGEMCTIAFLVLTVYWIEEYQGEVGWDSHRNNGDNHMVNTAVLAWVLGIFFNAQAISNYRVLPLKYHPWLNRLWYCLMQACAITSYIVALAAIIMTPPSGERTFWRIDNWCMILALAIYIPHALISMGRALLENVWPVSYETWAEVNNQLDNTDYSSLRERKTLKGTDINASGLDGDWDRRTVYTVAPKPLPRGQNLPVANANVGAEVPVAPANAPRWAENPRTHAGDYFLLWRSKWANIGFWSMGAAFLMFLSAIEQTMAIGDGYWAQGSETNDAQPGLNSPLNEDSTQAHVLGVLGLMVVAALTFVSYAAMPPRTTLVKNGILTDARRPSLSYNANAQIGAPGQQYNQNVV